MAASPLLDALAHVWQALTPLRLPMAVMGGLALASWKHTRSTRDVDLLVGTEAESPDELIAVLQGANVRLKLESTPRPLGSLEILQFLYVPPESLLDIQIDVLLGTSEYHTAALDRRVSIMLAEPAVEVAVLSCEDLILHKLLAGRVIDLADAAALIRENHQNLDTAHLHKWSARLNLDTKLQKSWQEALPGTELP